jgi:hypothetical protein
MLLGLISEYANKRASEMKCLPSEVQWHRRELREAIGWSDTRLRKHLEELVTLEYVVALSGSIGLTYQYRLLYEAGQSSGKFVPGLKTVEKLRQEAIAAGIICASADNLADVLPHLAGQNGHLAPTSPTQTARLKDASEAHEYWIKSIPAVNLADFSEELIREKSACRMRSRNGGSYPQ